MAIKRHFMDWTGAFLRKVAAILSEDNVRGNELSLNNYLLVLPSARAGRRLLELLISEAEAADKILVPPRIITVGALPEFLYTPQRAVATTAERLYLWAEALKQIPDASLQAVLADIPSRTSNAAWFKIADQLIKLDDLLLSESRTVQDVINCLKASGNEQELFRWKVIADITKAYEEGLNSSCLSDLNRSRLAALDDGALQNDYKIYLVGLADLNKLSKRFLAGLKQGVDSFIFAPQAEKDAFDEFGAVLAKAWSECKLDLADDMLQLSNLFIEQADLLCDILANEGQKFSAEEISIGFADEELVPYVEDRLNVYNVAAHRASGIDLINTRPLSVLKALSAYLSSQSFSDMAALLRHIDFQSWVRSSSEEPFNDYIVRLDKFYDDHLPASWAKVVFVPDSNLDKLKSRVDKLLKNLTSGSRKSINEWVEAIAALLDELYVISNLEEGSKKTSSEDRVLDEALSKIVQVLDELLALQRFRSLFSAVEVINLILQLLSEEQLAVDPEDSAVEFLGWLELQLDDAPLLIITGLNDSKVPGVVNSDLFLPNHLRASLGLADNERRYARDAFALQSMLHSKEKLYLLSSLKSIDHSPLFLSRLLLASKGKALARQVLAGTSVSEQDFVNHRLSALKESSQAQSLKYSAPPPPEEVKEKISSISVTAFKTYLSCPYRYYLKHVLRLTELDDQELELDGALFGTLGHEVLSNFGKSSISGSTDAKELNSYLQDELRRLFNMRFGTNVLPVVQIQLEQLSARLKAFSTEQAKWAAKGWEIRKVEFGEELYSCSLKLSSGNVKLKGRIDRIDYNQALKCWCIIDYKLSDYAKKPEQTHHKGRAVEWIDLQLPAYRYIWKNCLAEKQTALADDAEIGLAYFNLPRALNELGLYQARWSIEELEIAEGLMHSVAEAIVSKKFWPPNPDLKDYFDPYKAICGV